MNPLEQLLLLYTHESVEYWSICGSALSTRSRREGAAQSVIDRANEIANWYESQRDPISAKAWREVANLWQGAKGERL